MNAVDQIATRLEEANRAYRRGESIMPDSTYDALEGQLRKLDPRHPALARIGAPGEDGWPKVKHPIPMGSLEKAQDETEFLDWFNSRVPRLAKLLITDKLDGISLRLTYENGELVEGATRGDGVEGEDITRNTRIIKGVQTKIAYTGRCHVRGEVVVTKTDFALHFQGESNPRNTAAGTAKRQKTDWRKAQHLTFIAYGFTSEDPVHQPHSRYTELEKLEKLGFTIPSYFQVEEVSSVLSYRQDYIDQKRASLDLLIDGLVVEIDDNDLRRAAGEHNMRPKGAVAFKFPHDSSQTILRDIIWQVGNSGRITPVAVFDPINLAGAVVSRASLHNVTNIQTLVGAAGQQLAFQGDHIMVSRRNDVIPYVESFLGTNEIGEETEPPSFEHPKNCPACGTQTTFLGEYLVCAGESCPAQVLGVIRNWVGKINILHFGDALLFATIEAGLVKTIGDLYRLEEEPFSNLTLEEGRRVGGMARRVIEQIQAHREVELHDFVGSLGIPLCGRKMCLVLANAGFDDLGKMAEATVDELAVVEGFGRTKAQAFRKGFDDRRELIYDILGAGVSIKAPQIVQVTGAKMAGHAVCFTGFRDATAEAAIVAEGGTIASGVSKNTTILVCKDPGSNSGKAKKARDLGIEVIDPQELWTRLGR